VVEYGMNDFCVTGDGYIALPWSPLRDQHAAKSTTSRIIYFEFSFSISIIIEQTENNLMLRENHD